jgi:hypothetical protein
VRHVHDLTGGRYWPRLAAGALAVGAGAAAFVWPSATVRVIGLLFGLNLVVLGTIRAGLLLFVPGYPEWYRIIGVVFSVLTAIAGVLCLRHISVAVVLLILAVVLGWIVHKLLESVLAAGDSADSGAERPVAGAALIAVAVTGLILSRLGPAALVTIGGGVLLGAGIVQVARAIAGLRAAYRAQV